MRMQCGNQEMTGGLSEKTLKRGINITWCQFFSFVRGYSNVSNSTIAYFRWNPLNTKAEAMFWFKLLYYHSKHPINTGVLGREGMEEWQKKE